MQWRQDFTAAATRTIGRIKQAGYAVSAHHMGEYVELHAVHLSGDGIPDAARCEGDGGAQTYQAARALAAMVEVTVEEGPSA
jgi:hypothetical protein